MINIISISRLYDILIYDIYVYLYLTNINILDQPLSILFLLAVDLLHGLPLDTTTQGYQAVSCCDVDVTQSLDGPP